jgi:hypothetical protein
VDWGVWRIEVNDKNYRKSITLLDFPEYHHCVIGLLSELWQWLNNLVACGLW